MRRENEVLRDRGLVPPQPTRRRVALLLRVVGRADRRLFAVLLGTLVFSAIAGAVQSYALFILLSVLIIGVIVGAQYAAMVVGVIALATIAAFAVGTRL